jgi:hypothetical protein
MVVITSKSEMRQALSRILAPSQPSRRIVSAFIGLGEQLDALPQDLSSVDVTCWLKPGGTDPNALRLMASRGARLSEVEDLHMKAYWSAAGGLVGSANLTTNGFLEDGLHEVLVECPAGTLDALTANLALIPISEDRLRQFEKEHVRYLAKNDGHSFFSDGQSNREVNTFEEWRNSFARTPWRIHLFTETYKNISAASREKLGALRSPKAELFFADDTEEFSADAWVLLVDATLKKDSSWGMRWMYTHFRSELRVGDDGREFGGIEWVQAFPSSFYGAEPFELSEGTKRAIRRALDEHGKLAPASDVDTREEPTGSLIETICRYL